MPQSKDGSPGNDESELPFSLQLELVVQDRDVIRSLLEKKEGDERNEYALEALKIGVLALRHVGGQATADLIQREIRSLQLTLDQHNKAVHTQLSGTLKEYFDPQSGRFSERVKRLVGQDGELSQLIKGFIDGENSQLSRTLTTHVGNGSPLMKQLDPEQSAGLLATLRKTVEIQLCQQRDQLLNEFSLDNKDGALKRLIDELTTKHGDLNQNLQKKIDEVVNEFSLDKEDSALSRLVQNVDRAQRTITNEFSLDSETSALARLKRELMTVLEAHVKTNAEFQEEVKSSLREMTARRQEQARSTEHGITFQRILYEFLQPEAQSRGDRIEFVGDNVGAIKNCKVGDVVIQLTEETASPGARIVFEAKEAKNYTLTAALSEIEEARKNRQAQVGVFVFSRKTAPSNLRPLSRFGSDIVVVWDSEDAHSDVLIVASLEAARAICFYSQCQREHQLVDFDSIEKALLDMEKHAANLDEIRKAAETIQSSSGKILERVRIDRAALENQIANLRTSITDLQSSLEAKVQGSLNSG
jgi:hypothetical protein